MRETGIERILVGLDGSDSSRAALDWAISLARGMEAELVAVYVTRPTVSRYPESGPTPSYDLVLRAEFEKDWCRPLIEAGIRHRMLVEEGRRPAEVIAAVADRLEADIIVVGRRGRGGVAEFLLGSVSHELTLHAGRPVLLISPSRKAGASGDGAAWRDGAWAHQGRERSP